MTSLFLQIVHMKNLSRCCQFENSLPLQVGWYLINRSQAMPSLVVQCVVDITCKMGDRRAAPTHTSLIIDELMIRESDRTQVNFYIPILSKFLYTNF